MFVRNPYLLRGFLSDTLDLELTNDDFIQILNPEMIPDKSDGKTNRLDIRVRTPSRQFNVEMQAKKDGFAPKRVMHYRARMYSEEIERGDNYENLETTYSVNVLGFEYFDCEDCRSSFSILENRRRELFTDVLSIHIFELPKIERDKILPDRVLDWLKVIRADSEEALKMVSDNTANPTVQLAAGAILELNADEKFRQRVFDRRSALNDYNSDMSRNRAEGRAEGRANAFLEIAESMRQNGFSEEQIKAVLKN